MEKVVNMIKPKPNPQQQLREWRRKLRQECRNTERQIRDMQREERNMQKAIKDTAKRNDMVSAKAGVIEEFVNDAVDTALDSEDVEEEIKEEVDKVLTAIPGETAAQLPEAVRKERVKQPAQTSRVTQEEEAIAEGVNHEEELEEIRAWLANIRS